MHLMMKCDMCYDRTSVGKRPMCATVCPSQALFFGTREEIAQMRLRSRPINTFQFGRQTIRTKVNMMIPSSAATEHVDVTSAMHDSETEGRRVSLTILEDAMYEADPA